MSIASATRATDPQTAELSAENSCAFCGSELADDQEWCLECGGARTLIHRTPDWRIGAAVIAGVLVVALVALAIALVSLSSDANRSAQTQSAAVAPLARPPAVSTATKPPRRVAGWPTGLSGWTVVLAQRHRQVRANNVAQLFAAAGIQVGVLNSSEHPSMPPGYWVVFSGRYPDRASAIAAAAKLRAHGHRRAVA